MALTNVLYLSICIPKGSNKGTPSAKKNISVVVPPMSKSIASSFDDSIAFIPIKLAAGPESIVSTGFLQPYIDSWFHHQPLIYIGAFMPSLSMDFLILLEKLLNVSYTAEFK